MLHSKSSAMATYKASIIIEHGVNPKFEIRTLPRPSPGPDELLIRLTLTSVCGTDSSLASGHLGPTRDILGHEGVGRIAELGTNVPGLDASVAIGQRVGVAWIRDACGTCGFCRRPDGEVRCEQMNHSGRKFDGTFAEYTIVPLRYLTRIPPELDSVPDEMVAPILCGGVTAFKAIKQCGVTPGEWIGILGAGGGVGSLGVQYAKAMGYRVIGVDVGPDKGEYTLMQGAEHFIDVATERDLKGASMNLTKGKGCSAVIVTAGVGKAYESAWQMLAPFGTYMCVGIPPPDQKVSFHPLLLIDNGARVMGSAIGTRADILDALEFVKRGLVTPILRLGTLEDMEDILDLVVIGTVQGKFIISLE